MAGVMINPASIVEPISVDRKKVAILSDVNEVIALRE